MEPQKWNYSSGWNHNLWIFLSGGRKMDIFGSVFTAHPPSKALNPGWLCAPGVLGQIFENGAFL